MSSAPNYTNEAATDILFPSDRDFAAFRAYVEDNYSGQMAKVKRAAVYKDGRTRATVYHARGLGAELKGRAHGYHNGNSVRTIYSPSED